MHGLLRQMHVLASNHQRTPAQVVDESNASNDTFKQRTDVVQFGLERRTVRLTYKQTRTIYRTIFGPFLSVAISASCYSEACLPPKHSFALYL